MNLPAYELDNQMKHIAILVALAAPLLCMGGVAVPQTTPVTAADTVTGRTFDAPSNTRPMSEKFWWSDEWFEGGVLEVPDNYKVQEQNVSYNNPADDTEIPAILYSPKADGNFPAVLFQHGRRGLDPLVQNLARRIAARGFVVLAPDVYAARFIDTLPIEHDPMTESDVNAGVDFLLAQDGLSSDKACLYSHTRGGFYTLRVAVAFERQNENVACYVSYYPHWQDPGAAEPLQVYRYHPDLDRLEIPTLVFIGEYEQYQRRRSIETAVSFMKKAGKDVRLIVYPGVGRGFDFRPPSVRTFADDLATKDAVQRAAAFMRASLE